MTSFPTIYIKCVQYKDICNGYINLAASYSMWFWPCFIWLFTKRALCIIALHENLTLL